MIRKTVIVVLTLGAVGAVFLWADSYRARTAFDGAPVHGWCTDLALRNHTGMHVTVNCGGVCFFYRYLLGPGKVGTGYDFEVTQNLGYFEYPYSEFFPSWVNKEHHREFFPCRMSKEHRHSEPPGRLLMFRGVCFPLLLLVLVLGFYPTLAFIRGPFRRWRRWRKGLCIMCGYDLTANVTGICPECGEPI